MSWAAPAFRWAGVRRDAAQGRPTVEVPAELSALGDRERALLEARLAWRCGASAVQVAPAGRAAVVFVDVADDRVDAALRSAADAAIASVAADAAAGWTAADEREHHGPFSWDAAGAAPRRPSGGAGAGTAPDVARRHVV